MAENEIKLFNKWDCEEVQVNDLGLKNYISLTNIILPKSRGRHDDKVFYKSEVNIVERLLNRMYVVGHKGKKHRLSSGHNVGKSQMLWKVLKNAFEIVEEKEKKNPVEVFVRAIENSAPREEVVTFQRGGIMARQAVLIAPQRRVDLALRMLAQGAYGNSRNKKKSAAEALAEEIINASKGEKCKAILEKERREKEASGAR